MSEPLFEAICNTLAWNIFMLACIVVVFRGSRAEQKRDCELSKGLKLAGQSLLVLLVVFNVLALPQLVYPEDPCTKANEMRSLIGTSQVTGKGPDRPQDPADEG